MQLRPLDEFSGHSVVLILRCRSFAALRTTKTCRSFATLGTTSILRVRIAHLDTKVNSKQQLRRARCQLTAASLQPLALRRRDASMGDTGTTFRAHRTVPAFYARGYRLSC